MNLLLILILSMLGLVLLGYACSRIADAICDPLAGMFNRRKRKP